MEEKVIKKIPENEPYILYYDPESAPAEEPVSKRTHEPESKSEPEPEPVIAPPAPIHQVSFQSLKGTHDPNEIDPEIILGVDNTPVQWGIVGKSGTDRVAVDLNEPHIVFVCGKQGSGKGYTIGVITEMLLSKTIPKISQVKKPATIIVFHKPREDIALRVLEYNRSQPKLL